MQGSRGTSPVFRLPAWRIGSYLRELLSNDSAVREAYQAVARSLDEAEPPVALQRMVQTGAELVVGVAHDPLFGSLVMVDVSTNDLLSYWEACIPTCSAIARFEPCQ